MRRPFRAALLISVFPFGVQAAELTVAAPAADVTVYADGAIVHRQGAVDLAPGSHVLKIDGVGASMVEQSLRVGGSGAIEIQSIEVRKLPRAESNKDVIAGLTAKANDARTRAANGQADLAALEKRKQFLEGVIESASKTTAQTFNAASLHQTLDTVEHDYAAVGHALVPRRAEVDALLEVQRKAEAELALAQGRQRDLYEVRVSVEASKAGRAGIDLSYRVPDASWASVYDMRLDTAAGKLTIEQDAAVTQDSGEDWSRVALTLTTARSVEGSVHTELWGTQTGLQDPQAPVYASMSASAPAPAPMMRKASNAESVVAPSPMATRKLATVQPGEFTSDFRIEGAIDLPNGIVEKRLPVSAQHLDATVDLLGVPDFDAHPAIQASFVNGQDMPIMAGKVGLYRDGAYVGVGAIAATQPGEKTSLTFGADQAVTMKLTQTANQHGEAGTFTSDNTLVKAWTVSVRNNHTHPVKLTLMGRIPVSTDEGLKIEPTGAAANPTKSGVNGPGVFSNDLQIGGSAETSLSYGFKARWPKDKQLTGAPL